MEGDLSSASAWWIGLTDWSHEDTWVWEHSVEVVKEYRSQNNHSRSLFRWQQPRLGPQALQRQEPTLKTASWWPGTTISYGGMFTVWILWLVSSVKNEELTLINVLEPKDGKYDDRQWYIQHLPFPYRQFPSLRLEGSILNVICDNVMEPSS